MATASTARRHVPRKVYALPLKLRFKWARETAGLSHDRLVEKLGRSNRGHLIKIENGTHVPRQDLRDSIADATNVPRDLFGDEDDEESDPMAAALLAVVRDLVRKEFAKERISSSDVSVDVGFPTSLVSEATERSDP